MAKPPRKRTSNLLTDDAKPAAGAALYLLPVTMADGDPADVLPPANTAILAAIKHFVVEDVRSARRFISQCLPGTDIDGLDFAELNEHTPAAAVPAMLQPLLQGNPVGVLSEAGCPAVADPGADIVAAAQNLGLRVVPLVGPNSIIMSLMASGFNGQRFAFDGYLPIDGAARQQRLKAFERDAAANGCTHIFIETPYRNNALVQTMAKTLAADTLFCVAAGLTSQTESIVTMPAAQWRTRTYDYAKTPAIFLIGAAPGQGKARTANKTKTAKR